MKKVAGDWVPPVSKYPRMLARLARPPRPSVLVPRATLPP